MYYLSTRDDVRKLRRLSAVCTSFRNVLVQHPHLESAILLPNVFKDEDMPATIQDIQHRHASLQTVVSCCNPYEECALATLLAAHCSIEEVLLAHRDAVPGVTIHLLAQFTSLHTCMLNMNTGYHEDFGGRSSRITSLLPFHHLPHLSLLELFQGTVHDLDAAKHLTTLTLTACEAVCSGDCMFTSSLVQLRLCDCLITNFHTQGVLACSRLRQLICSESCVSAGNPSRTLCLDVQHSDNNELQVPTSLTTLSALTELEFGVRHVGSTFEMNWLTQLATLQSVSIGFNSTVPLSVRNSERLESLTGLTSLQLQNDSCEHRVTIGFDLGSFVALKSLVLSGSFTFEHNLIHVASLQSLKEVSLRGFDGTAARLAFTHKLGCDRPDVMFSCSDGS